jgi:hypothetical protein
MDLLNHREGGMVFFIRLASFLLYRNGKRLRESSVHSKQRQLISGTC